jgi:hypothetical protein
MLRKRLGYMDFVQSDMNIVEDVVSDFRGRVRPARKCRAASYHAAIGSVRCSIPVRYSPQERRTSPHGMWRRDLCR